MGARRDIADLGRRVLRGQRLDREQALCLAELGGRLPDELMYWAHRVRSARFANRVRLCAIVAGKVGGCGEDCKWCAQSARHAARVSPSACTPPGEIVRAARRARDERAAALGIVNSGRQPSETDLRAVEEAVGRIRAELGRPPSLCASLGELTDDQARRLARAGVRRYNHNLETSRRMFARMVTTHGYDDRLATLAAARDAGLELCCGGLFGLGETWDDRIELALTLRDRVRPSVVPLNFLQAIPGTPLAGTVPLSPPEALRIVAVFRLVLPAVDLKIAGGREVNLRGAQAWMFYAGATSCIVGNYLTTRGRPARDDFQLIADLGLEIVPDLAGAPLAKHGGRREGRGRSTTATGQA